MRFFGKPKRAKRNNSRMPVRRVGQKPPTSIARAVSSAGLERLPYKQEVTGSNPVLPTFVSSNVFKRNKFGVVVQLVSTLACQARGRGFEPRRPRQVKSSKNKKEPWISRALFFFIYLLFYPSVDIC